MRTKHLLSTLIFICFFLFVPTMYAQDADTPDKTEKAKIQEDRANDIRAGFLEMFAKAKLAEPIGKPCDPMPIIEGINPQKLLPSAKDINQKFSQLQSMFDKGNKSEQFEGIDKGFLATKMDKLLQDFSNVKLNKDGEPILDAQFTEAYNDFARRVIAFKIITLSSGDCTIRVTSGLEPGSKGLRFPTMNWSLAAAIGIDCDCTEKNKERVKSTQLFYSSDIQGHYTATEQNFKNSKITNPQVNINYLACCEEEKKEESKSQIEDDNARGQQAKNTGTGGHFFIVGNVGIPISGEETDFFGFAYGIGAVYLQKLSRKFMIGGEIGYTRFTGRETDFGFETDGRGFIPIKVAGIYNFSETIGIEAGAGYAISTSDEDSAFIYGIGPLWRLYPSLELLLKYVGFSFGEDNNLGFVQLGVRASLGRKKNSQKK